MPRGESDRVFEALKHPLRRRLLTALSKSNPQPAVPTSEGDRDIEEIEIGLVHNHLPKLETYGYITWDREKGRIEKGANWQAIGPLITLLEENEGSLPDDW